MLPASLTSQKRRRTIEGLIRFIYNNQKMTSRRANRPLPAYTLESLQEWLFTKTNYQTLYDSWVAANYAKDLSPSIDRKDNTLSYTLINIQLVTWKENLLNQKKQNKSGEYPHVTSKAVHRMDMEGNILATHCSIGNALREIRNGSRVGTSNVAEAANGNLPHAYGFRWAWA